MIRDESRELTEGQKQRVLARVGDLGFSCGSCGSRDFRVGEALEMGFLFLSEEHGSYMVALTCENPECESPRTGIRLRDYEFFYEK